MASAIQDTIVGMARELGVDPRLALAVAQNESGLNPRAVGDNGSSFGLFQLHRGGELGALTPEQAYDPVTNARTALTVMAGVQRANPGLSPGEIAAKAQRPLNPAAYATVVNGIYRTQFQDVPGLLNAPVSPGGVTGGSAEAAAATGAAPGDEGYLFQVHIPGNGDVGMRSATARKLVGAAVLASGAVLGLAGAFLLLGGRKTLPAPLRVIQGAVSQRGSTARARVAEEGKTQRQQERGQERRREKERSGSPQDDLDRARFEREGFG